jgi:hypothetical protein
MLRVDGKTILPVRTGPGWLLYLWAIRSMMSRAWSPVIFSATQPRMTVMLNGLRLELTDARRSTRVDVKRLSR